MDFISMLNATLAHDANMNLLYDKLKYITMNLFC